MVELLRLLLQTLALSGGSMLLNLVEPSNFSPNLTSSCCLLVSSDGIFNKLRPTCIRKQFVAVHCYKFVHLQIDTNGEAYSLADLKGESVAKAVVNYFFEVWVSIANKLGSRK